MMYVRPVRSKKDMAFFTESTAKCYERRVLIWKYRDVDWLFMSVNGVASRSFHLTASFAVVVKIPNYLLRSFLRPDYLKIVQLCKFHYRQSKNVRAKLSFIPVWFN